MREEGKEERGGKAHAKGGGMQMVYVREDGTNIQWIKPILYTDALNAIHLFSLPALFLHQTPSPSLSSNLSSSPPSPT